MPHDHPHNHAHHSCHGHSHGSTNRHVLRVSLAVIAGFMLVEAAAGWFSGSLALLSDAGHMFSDAAALALVEQNRQDEQNARNDEENLADYEENLHNVSFRCPADARRACGLCRAVIAFKSAPRARGVPVQA